MGTFRFISNVSYLVKGISRLYTSHVDSFDKSFMTDKLALTETIAE